MKYGVKHGLQGHMSLSYTLVRWEGDSAIERAEADSVAFFSDEDVARACAAALNAEWGVLAALLESRAPQARPNIDANNICDPNLIRPLLDFVRAQKLALSKACEGAKTYGDSRMVDVCSVCHEPLYEHVKPGVDAGGRELAPAQHAPAPSAPVPEIREDDLRDRRSFASFLLPRVRELCHAIETFPASAMQTDTSQLASQLLKLVSDVINKAPETFASEHPSFAIETSTNRTNAPAMCRCGHPMHEGRECRAGVVWEARRFLPYWKRAIIVIGIGLITAVNLAFDIAFDSFTGSILNRLKARRSKRAGLIVHYERDRYCKLTCEGGSERGECKCERPTDCEKGNFKR